MPAGYRKFGGKLYEKEQTVWSKREAQNVADKVRRIGMNARIVKAPKGEAFSTSGQAWIVYVRRAKKRVARG